MRGGSGQAAAKHPVEHAPAMPRLHQVRNELAAALSADEIGHRLMLFQRVQGEVFFTGNPVELLARFAEEKSRYELVCGRRE